MWDIIPVDVFFFIRTSVNEIFTHLQNPLISNELKIVDILHTNFVDNSKYYTVYKFNWRND